MAADLFGDRQGLIDAGADGGALQVIAGQPETGKARATFCDCGQSVAVTEVVLRQGARPNRDIGKDGITFHREDRGDLAVHENCQFFGLQFCCVSVGCSADETGQKSVAFRSAAGEKGGIPDGTEDAEAGGAGHEEAEAIQGVADILLAIAERNYRDGGVFDGGQRR